MPRVGWRLAAQISRLGSSTGSEEPDVDLALNVGPLLGLTQAVDELLKGGCVLWGELEPGQEVERLAEVAAVVQPTGDRRQVLESGRDVVGALLEDPAALI